ncbi:ComEA family DNA-binding protein [Variovorax terrae]|uniref:Helix-hairpin-helix domain-containing protein n=1 Tax=Variovorax terrae TaxID=2923278 RepID=A0A9X1VXW1_9BURK|nr:helix-hairpin-helix domain-containing protein [Variovorax terrae]MCJ0764057.1 helix-hairpin-helix domain-containing protein [Variovorax terrae]
MLKKILAILVMLYASLSFAAVEVNKATAAELDALKGIGPGISNRIVDERKKGDFKDWNDFISRVKGVGEITAGKFSAEGLTVNGTSMKGAAAAAPAAKKDDKPAAKADDKKADMAKPAAAVASAPAAKDDKKDAKAEAKAKKDADKKAKEEAAAKKAEDAKAKKEADKKAKDDAKKAKAADAAKPAASAASAPKK